MTAFFFSAPGNLRAGMSCLRLAGDAPHGSRTGLCPRGHERDWSIVFGQPLEGLRSAWEARPGGVAIAAGPGVELQKAPSFARHRTRRKDSRRVRKGRSRGTRGLSVWALRSWRQC